MEVPVAWIRFHPDFDFKGSINSFLEAHGVRLGAIEIEIVGRGPIYRPHRNVITMGKSGETRFQELRTVLTPGRDGGVAAVSWVMDHDYRGALPSSSLIEGWRVRSGDIQIGDNALFQSLFPESRFNAWCVAETHVLDARILPNGRRDHFEQNAHYFDLMNHLAPHARDVAQRCRTSSVARNIARTIDARLTDCAERLRILEKGGLGQRPAGKLIKQLQDALDHLQRLSGKSAIAPLRQSEYQVKVERLRRRLKGITTDRPHPSILKAFHEASAPFSTKYLRQFIKARTICSKRKL